MHYSYIISLTTYTFTNINHSVKARRAFWALKGIIRLQALVRGHLVRRQAVATLSCMRAIVEFQALVRGQSIRHSRNGPQIPEKRTSGKPVVSLLICHLLLLYWLIWLSFMQNLFHTHIPLYPFGQAT